MRSFVRFLLIFSLVVWLGGIIFFSGVIAPAVFSVLPAQEAAGQIVNRSLGALHYIGMACGVIFLAATFLAPLREAKAIRSLMTLMIVCTTLSQFAVLPQMSRIRGAVGGAIQALPAKDAGRAAFDRLREISVLLEGITLLAGIGAVILVSREQKTE